MHFVRWNRKSVLTHNIIEYDAVHGTTGTMRTSTKSVAYELYAQQCEMHPSSRPFRAVPHCHLLFYACQTRICHLSSALESLQWEISSFTQTMYKSLSSTDTIASHQVCTCHFMVKLSLHHNRGLTESNDTHWLNNDRLAFLKPAAHQKYAHHSNCHNIQANQDFV